MENLTHSLVGAAIAELALPAAADRPRRRLFVLAGVVAANLPDADLLYTRITPEPLGYLLHHRGHTHTLAGLVAQGLLFALPLLVPAVRRHAWPVRGRLVALIAAGLLSHIVLDSWNSYGVHPFWPVDNRWMYGDAVFILEPWLWLPLGIAAALNAHRPATGRVLALLVAGLMLALGAVGMTPWLAVLALGIASAVFVAALRAQPATRRSGVALAVVALFVAGSFALGRQARALAMATPAAAPPARVLDVVLTPTPGNPLCWSALAITVDEGGATYALTEGRVAPLAAGACGDAAGPVRWAAPSRHSLTALRERARADCRVRAWLQFGRAPALGDASIADARFGGGTRGNFSAMPLAARPGAGCPANLPGWEMPRADLLGNAMAGGQPQ